MKKYLYILLSLACVAGFASCEKSDDAAVPADNKDGANLTISVDVPTFSATTRTAIATDPKNSGNSWTNWDKFVDGALLYRVTIFVLDSDNKLAAYRNFYSGNDIQADGTTYGGNGFYENSAVNTSATTGVAVKATFNASSPLHKGEQLQAGDYKVLAVANYAPIATTDAIFAEDETAQAYDGLGVAAEDGKSVANGDGDFTTLVNKIISAGVGFDFSTEDGQALFNYTLNSGDDRVCKLMPQPLVMVRDVTLTNGQKTTLEGKLSRTFARIRLDVQNKITSVNSVNIRDLQFGTYASQKAYLFNDKSEYAGIIAAADEDEFRKDFAYYTKADGGAGVIEVTSEDAIIPYEDKTHLLPVGATLPLFDCYILEGKISGTAYSLVASYYSSSGTADATMSDVKIGGWEEFENEHNETIGSILDYYVYIRGIASTSVSQGGGGGSNSGAYTGETIAQRNLLTVATDEAGTIKINHDAGAQEGGSAVLNANSIWKLIPNEDKYNTSTADWSSSNIYIDGGTQYGWIYGYMQSLGNGMYLQAYDGGTSKVPKLGYNKSELIFAINFTGEDERGTIFCKVGNQYYYLPSYSSTSQAANATIEWTATDIDPTEIVSENISSGYCNLTFETITGTTGSQEHPTTIANKITMGDEASSKEENAIVRNDFFWGTIPIQLGSSSSN